MKFIQILFISSIILVTIKSYCTPEEEELISATKIRDYEDCERRTTSGELWEYKAYKCCYLYYKVDTDNYSAKVHTCMMITQTEYDNIKDTVDNYERNNNVKGVKIKCNSSYIHIGLFYILLLVIIL